MYLLGTLTYQAHRPRGAAEPAQPGCWHRPLQGGARPHAVGKPGGVHHFTAPKVRPCTSCFWLNQPKTTMGPIAMKDAADNLAQNKPSGLE